MAVTAISPPPGSQLGPIHDLVLGFLGLFGYSPTAPVRNPFLDLVWGLYRRIESFTDNQTPSIGQPTVLGTTTAADGSVTVTMTLNATDYDGDPLTYRYGHAEHGTVAAGPTPGTFTYTYTPGVNYPGADSFTVKTSDTGLHVHGLLGFFAPDLGHSRTATVAVTISNVAPVITEHTGAVTGEDGGVTGSFKVTDANGDPVTVAVSQAPAYGTLDFAVTDLDATTHLVEYAYAPTLAGRLQAGLTDEPDLDGFAFTASDGSAESAPLSVGGLDVAPAYLAVGARPFDGRDAAARVTTGTDGRIYVFNDRDATVTVLNTDGTLDTRIPVDYSSFAGLGRLITGADGSVYVTNGGFSAAGALTVIHPDNTTESMPVGLLPSGVAVSSDGTLVYVANYGDSTVSVLHLETGASELIDNVPSPGALSLSPDGSRLYVLTDNSAVLGDPTSQARGLLVINTSDPADRSTVEVGVVSAASSLALSPDGRMLYLSGAAADAETTRMSMLTTVDTATNDVTSVAFDGVTLGVRLSPDGSVAWVTVAAEDLSSTLSAVDTATGQVLGTVPAPGFAFDVALSPDGMQAYLPDYYGSSIKVISVVPQPVNNAPYGGTATVDDGFGDNGQVTGQVTGVLDPEQTPISYGGSGATPKGAVVVDPDGHFTYTPGEDYRHLAAASDATAEDLADGFDVTAADAGGATTTVHVTVPIDPHNQPPTGGSAVIDPGYGDAGAVTGHVTGVTDADDTTFTYSGSTTTAKGELTVDEAGTFTFVPNTTARHDASAVDAPIGDTDTTFTVVADDGHGGTTDVTVTVPISPHNLDPYSGGDPTIDTPYPNGQVTGWLNVVDPEGDILSNSEQIATTYGAVQVNGNYYVYTPDAGARLAAYVAGEDLRDTFTVTLSDGHGGTTTVTVTGIPVVPVAAAVTDTVTLPGTAAFQPLLAADGTRYLTVSGVDVDGVAHTAVVVVGPDDPSHFTTVIAGPGTPSGPVSTGTDQKLYQVSSTATASYVAVVDPHHLTDPPVIITGAPGQPYSSYLPSGPDGKSYLFTSDGTTAYVTVIDPDHLGDPPTIINAGAVGGWYAPTATAGPDGKLYLTTYTGGGQPGYTGDITRVVVIDPTDLASAPTVVDAGSGHPYSAVSFAADGTPFQVTYSYSDFYTVSVTSLADPVHPTTHSVTGLSGYPNGYLISPTGVLYRITGSPTGASITVITPDDPAHPQTLAVPGTNIYSTALNREGTLYALSYTYDSEANASTDWDLTIVDPGSPGGSVTIPARTDSTSFSYRYPSVVVGRDGTAYLTDSSRDPVTYDYTVKVLAFRADDPLTPVTVLERATSALVADDVVPSEDGNASLLVGNTLYLIDAADLTHPTSVTLPGIIYDSRTDYADTTRYVTVSGLMVDGTAHTGVIVIDPDHPNDFATVVAGPGSPSGYLDREGRKLYQISSTGAATYVAVIDLDHLTDPPAVITGAPGQSYLSYLPEGPDGKRYLFTNTSTTAYLTVIDPAHLTDTPTIVDAGPGGWNSVTMPVGPDGRLYLTTYTSGTQPGYTGATTRVVIVDPADLGSAPTVIDAASGHPLGSVRFTGDGTPYQVSYTSAGQTDYTVYVTSLEDPANPVTVTVAGVSSWPDAYLFAPNGIGYAFTTTSDVLTVSVTTPEDPSHPVAVAISGNESWSRVISSDGVLFLVTDEYTNTGPGTGYIGDFRLTVIDPADPLGAITIPGLSISDDVVMGTDGTAYLTTTSYQSSYTTRVSVFRPEDRYHPVTIDLPGYTDSDVVATPDGNAYIVIGDKMYLITNATAQVPQNNI